MRMADGGRRSKRKGKSEFNTGHPKSEIRILSAEGKCVLDDELLFLAVGGQRADGRAGTGAAAGVPDGCFEEPAELPGDEIPGPHILRFLLAPDDALAIGKLRDRGLELGF